MPEKVFVSSPRISNTCGINMRKIDFKVLFSWLVAVIISLGLWYIIVKWII